MSRAVISLISIASFNIAQQIYIVNCGFDEHWKMQEINKFPIEKISDKTIFDINNLLTKIKSAQIV